MKNGILGVKNMINFSKLKVKFEEIKVKAASIFTKKERKRIKLRRIKPGDKKPSRVGKVLGRIFNRTLGKVVLITFAVIFVIVALVGGITAGALGGAVLGFIKTAEPLSRDQLLLKIETSYIYDSEGNVIAMLTGRENQNREPVFYKDTPEFLSKAFIAIEDERFESHIGIDLKRIGSAIYEEFLTSGSGHGGSTITQQVVRNITLRTERTLKRKVQEWYLAISLERMMNKWQILELYMNVIYMGNGCYGVQSASNMYFGKQVKDLTLAEAAILAGITNSPTNYDPYNNYTEKGRDNALKRGRTILGKMHDLEFITDIQYENALAEEIVFADKDALTKDIKVHNYFVDHVINEVAKDLMEKQGLSLQMALTTIHSYGIIIHTTMDPQIQEIVDDVFTDDKYFHENENIDQIPQAGMVIMDPLNGKVLAMRGGYGEKTANQTLNRATQIERPAGSSFKPLSVFAPALDRRLITPATIIDDSPVYMLGIENKKYPVNYTRYYEGLMTVRYAVKRSVNVPAAKVYMMFNNPNIPLEYLRKAGIDRDQKNLSLALGGLERGVSPLEMTAAYVPFANKGIYYKPICYTKVTDKDGNILLENKPEYTAVYDEATAYVMTDILKDVNSGSRRAGELGGTAAKLGTIRNGEGQLIPTAGKTGTTDDDLDRWYVGYSIYYTSAVWYGYDQPATISGIPNNDNPAALIWNGVMTKLHENKQPKDFPRPSDVVKKAICVYSGKTPTQDCYNDPRGSAVLEEYFIKGTEPSDDEICDVHIRTQICKDSTDIWGRNLLAGPNCPAESILERVFVARTIPFRLINPDDPYPLDWKFEFPAGEYCTVHGTLHNIENGEITDDILTTPSQIDEMKAQEERYERERTTN